VPELSICLAVDEFHPMGGTERQVVELAAELHRREIPVEVLSRWPLPANNRYVDELDACGVRVRSPGRAGRRGGRLRRVPYVLARLRAGTKESLAVEAQLWRWQAARMRAMRRPGFVLHELPFFGVLSPAGRATLRAARTPLVLTALGRMEGVVPVVDVPWAVVTADGQPTLDPADVDVTWVPSMGPRALAALRPDPRRPRTDQIVYGGRLVAGKGVDVLVRAAALLEHDVELIVAGYGPERAPLEDLARGIGARVRFTEALETDAFLALLGQADVAVFPGLEGEGLPSFVVEALAAGVPVVGTDVGSVGRAVDRAVPPGDERALARAIDEVLAGDLEERRLRARLAFELDFAPASVVDRYIERYREALARPFGAAA
jgi:glycosyltransferase involved in cell wall biosynthesis